MQRQSWVAAGAFGVAGLLAALCVNLLGSGPDSDLPHEMIWGGAAAFLMGALLWQRVALRKGQRVSLWRGALVGALVGFLAHPLYWYIGAVYAWAFLPPPVGDDYLGPLHGLWAAGVYALVSWVVAGWVTVPVGALTGGILAAAGRRRTS